MRPSRKAIGVAGLILVGAPVVWLIGTRLVHAIDRGPGTIRPASLRAAARARPDVPTTTDVSRGESRVAAPRDGARLAGVVRDAGGGVVVGATVVAYRDGEPRTELGLVRSDAEGRFELFVSPEVVQVEASAAEYSTARVEVLAPAGGIALVMAPAAIIAGRVIEGASGRPIEGARVAAVKKMGGTDAGTAPTDANGAFRIALSPGGYELQAVGQGWRTSTAWVAAEVGRAQAIELRAFKAVTLRGSVRVDGRACRRGAVLLDGSVTAAADVRSDGSIAVDGVMPGKYAALVRCGGARDLRDTIEVSERPAEQVWNLSSGASVTGIVRNSGGGPASNVTIAVVPVGDSIDRTSAACISDVGGRFTCSGLAAGAHECSASIDGRPASEPVAISLSDTGSTSIEIQLVPSASLRVTVVSAKGTAVDRASAVARRANGETAIGQRESPGQFMFRSLRLGAYEVSLMGTSQPPSNVRLDQDGGIVNLRLIAPEAGVIKGRAVTEAGQPVPDGWVTLRGVRPGEALNVAPAMTAADGRFELDSVLPGSYVLAISGDAGSGTLEDVQPGQNVTVRVQSFAPISGVVIDERGAPCKVFVLTSVSPDGEQVSHRVFDEHGRWVLPWLVPGRWEIRAQSDASFAAQEIVVSPGARPQVALTLRRGAESEVPDQSGH